MRYIIDRGLLDCKLGLTAKYAKVKLLENVVEDEPLSQTQVDMTNTKKQNTC